MINQEKLNIDFQNELNRLQEMMNLRNSNQDPPVDLYDLKGSDEGDNEIDLLTKEPSDTLLIGDEIISTTPAKENDEFIKSSADNLVLIPREFEEENLDIDLPLGEHLDTLSMRDMEIDFDPIRDIEELERLLADDPVLVPRVFDEPLGNSDSVPRSYDVTFSNPIFDFNDGYTLCYDNLLFDEEFEDISSMDPLESTPVIDESILLVTPLLDSREISLRKVERFDPFFSLTQSGVKTRVIETPSFGFHHMPSPCPTAYSPKEIPSGESKVHIKVLSVLWGNRLPIRTVRVRCLGAKD
nr:NAC domain-containing protein [Tanacetum cinerariifolium]